MRHVAAIAANDPTAYLFSRLGVYLRKKDITISRIQTTSSVGVRTDCFGKDLVIVGVTGTKEETRTGIEILHNVINAHKVGILFDYAGYLACISSASIPFKKVRFGVCVGKGKFDFSLANCLAMPGKRPILTIPHDDWHDGFLEELVARVDSTLSISPRMISA